MFDSNGLGTRTSVLVAVTALSEMMTSPQMYTSPSASASSAPEPWLELLWALETLTRNPSEPDTFVCMVLVSSKTCDFSESVEGTSLLGEAIGSKLKGVPGELWLCEVVAELLL